MPKRDEVEDAFGVGQKPDEVDAAFNQSSNSILRPNRDCHVGQHRVRPETGGLIICPEEYGDTCRDSTKRAKCTGCAWACTDCLIKLKQTQRQPKLTARPVEEYKGQTFAEFTNSMTEQDRMLFEGLFLRYYGSTAWGSTLAQLLKQFPTYRKKG
jgi:hypothetical protein